MITLRSPAKGDEARDSFAAQTGQIFKAPHRFLMRFWAPAFAGEREIVRTVRL
jgi:hypothetical protein